MRVESTVRVCWLLPALAWVVAAQAQNRPAPNQASAVDLQFQAAASDYQAGKLSESAAILEKLEPGAPRSFELHELLGLVYAAESATDKSIEQLQHTLQGETREPG